MGARRSGYFFIFYFLVMRCEGASKALLLRPYYGSFQRRMGPCSAGAARGAAALVQLLTYAHVCSRMLTYAHVCSRMLITVRSRRAAQQLPSFDYYGRAMHATSANGWGCPYEYGAGLNRAATELQQSCNRAPDEYGGGLGDPPQEPAGGAYVSAC